MCIAKGAPGSRAVSNLRRPTVWSAQISTPNSHAAPFEDPGAMTRLPPRSHIACAKVVAADRTFCIGQMHAAVRYSECNVSLTLAPFDQTEAAWHDETVMTGLADGRCFSRNVAWSRSGANAHSGATMMSAFREVAASICAHGASSASMVAISRFGTRTGRTSRSMAAVKIAYRSPGQYLGLRAASTATRAVAAPIRGHVARNDAARSDFLSQRPVLVARRRPNQRRPIGPVLLARLVRQHARDGARTADSFMSRVSAAPRIWCGTNEAPADHVRGVTAPTVDLPATSLLPPPIPEPKR